MRDEGQIELTDGGREKLTCADKRWGLERERKAAQEVLKISDSCKLENFPSISQNNGTEIFRTDVKLRRGATQEPRREGSRELRRERDKAIGRTEASGIAPYLWNPQSRRTLITLYHGLMRR